MPRDEEELRHSINILKILNKAIESGPWSKTIYLRGTGKKLKELRDRFRLCLDLTEEEEAALKASGEKGVVAKAANQIEVFISLYNAAGNEIKNWERLLNSLGNSIITRPILKNEQDVRELIRSKVNKKNEAYVIAYVNTSDIIQVSGSHIPRDTLGHELLMLKNGAIQLENIKRFLHVSGHYLFQDGRLVRQGDIEFSEFF